MRTLLGILAAAAVLVSGCASHSGSTSNQQAAAPANAVTKSAEAKPASPPAPAAPAVPAAPVALAAPSAPATPAIPVSPPAPAAVTTDKATIIRIKAGVSEAFKDSAGNVWLPDQGFDGGDTVAREESLQIANTKDPQLYRTEHYAMSGFSQKLPNGKYLAKLHFAETFEGITGPGQRVFSYKVHGHEFKDLDLWVKAGGPNRAYIETIPVEVTDGVFKIEFISQIENPEINAIELIPQS